MKTKEQIEARIEQINKRIEEAVLRKDFQFALKLRAELDFLKWVLE